MAFNFLYFTSAFLFNYNWGRLVVLEGDNSEQLSSNKYYNEDIEFRYLNRHIYLCTA